MIYKGVKPENIEIDENGLIKGVVNGKVVVAEGQSFLSAFKAAVDEGLKPKKVRPPKVEEEEIL